ncbi:tetratricopeptide repeat protein [Phytoactinopolyspora mesophila]|uniref:tetratricopeptide repeat protein n=1 Tax=Phytoactinopolyspora mesophila TaxID=2650750 RepID=UPI001391AB9F
MPPLEFAALLRQHRSTAGLSQEELAQRAGLSGDAVAALERGRRRAPRPLTVRLLADALRLEGEARAAFVEAAWQPAPADRPTPRPTPLTPDEFIGRAADLAESIRLLNETATRVLTLTGPGGVGKTRMATEVAAAMRASFPDGVHWVSLSPSSNEPAVTAAIAAALGLNIPRDSGRLDLLAEHIGARRMMVVLDNCEHVVDVAATLCVTLLRRCPALSILATSRELLRVPGEVIQPVPPLARPHAARLFITRAGSHGVDPPEENLAHIDAICERLDGLPLAIELAAARVRILTIEQIADELSASTRILSSGVRTAPHRHQSLHAAIEWSHDLLDAEEQRFFAVLSVFSGGWTMPAAHAVWSSVRPGASWAHAVDLSARLADKSLIIVTRDEATARYGMFDVIHEYAADCLTENGLRSPAELAHLSYYAQLAVDAEPELNEPDRWIRLRELDAEFGNMRAAMRRALSHQQHEQALRLAGALYPFAYLRGYYSTGRAWLETALAAARAQPQSPEPAMLAKAMCGSGYLAFLQCEYDVAVARLEAAVELYRQHSDQQGTAVSLRYLGSVARERGAYEQAEDLHRQSLAIYAEHSDDTGSAWARHHLAFVSWLQEKWTAAREYSTVALEHFERVSDTEGIVGSLVNLGAVALYTGDLDTAETRLRRALNQACEHGFHEGVAWAQNQLGLVAWSRGQLDTAAELLDASLAEHRELGDRWRAASVLEALAAVAHAHGQTWRAAFLLGAASAVRNQIGAPVPVCEQPAHEHTTQAARDALGEDQFSAAWASGQNTPLHQI